MSRLTVTTRGRAAAEAGMVDTIEFRANDGAEEIDPETGDYVTTPGTLLYDGPCQVQVTDTMPRDANVGGQQIVVERTIIKVPWDAVDIPPNTVGTITAAGVGSGSTVGAAYRVTGTHDKTFATATRLPCERVTA